MKKSDGAWVSSIFFLLRLSKPSKYIKNMYFLKWLASIYFFGSLVYVKNLKNKKYFESNHHHIFQVD